MSGTIAGGKAAAAMNKARYGEDFYKHIGAIGGAKQPHVAKGFAANRELAREAGRIGGLKSRPRAKAPQGFLARLWR